ncbi:DnaA N-terminal domain-containing protein [Anaerolinea thermophila]|uniref:DnaA N-terminal domain-containing protein n=1 Tax=Anaerolinea thermophila (strain DSM 14523 / JCM 11388 / NBRC 100420 / UNI-1) TaxID=926569 RepID=E8MYX3_ANATU|nr:DnaA N-terminal domain-containing protein [Anaerolinea thermophila]BAJ64459.1 hypothetical protein ANT_24330 [Anaerolinea thermophila UNI-1]
MDETNRGISPEQAWKSALEQIRQEMSRAAFDTWVASAQLIGWENSCFRASVRNAYARDWLESRLSGTLRRKLSALMGSEQDVEFVVWDEPAPVTPSAETAEESLEIEGVSDETLYQELVQPDRVITLPGYFRRWVGVLGPELAWMYVAFRQAAYYAERGRKHGTSQVHFSGKQIAALCGITERTFWNRSAKAETWERLRGLVERGDGGTGWRQEDGRPVQTSHRYRVWLSLPLTPQDTARLVRWLKVSLEGGVRSLLERAGLLTLSELEDFEGDEIGRPMSVRQIVHAVAGAQMGREEIEALVAIVQERLMPSGDILMITHFFLEQVLPRLGAGPAWLYVLLRDRCWEGSEPRDVVRIEGGYAELARWLGLSRPLTVYEWLNTKPSLLWAYVRPVEQERRWSGDSKWDIPRYFRVLLSDFPPEYLNLKDEEAVRAYFSRDRFTLGVREFEPELLRDFHSLVTQFSEFGYATFIVWLRNFHTPVTQFSEFGYATFIPRLRDFHSLVTQFSELKLLNSGLSSKALVKDQPPPLIPPLQTQTSPPADEVNRLVGVRFGWEILEHLGVNPEVQERMAESGIEPWMVISWLLYAAGRKTIQDPLAFAVARVLKRRQGAGGEHDVLAQNPLQLAVRLREMDLPARLKQALLGDNRPSGNTVLDNTHRRYVEGVYADFIEH